MAYFVTGATGFIGRYLVQEILDHRDGEVFVLCREGSRRRMEALIEQWGSDRVTLVVGDLGEPDLGVDPTWVEAHVGQVDHFFHLAAIYDMTASDEVNERLNVGGTRHAVELAGRLEVGCFHQVSSIAASGDFRGVFDESMFDEGQRLPSPYHRTKFESEKIVREECPTPWRVYRPAVVVGDSETGAMDKIDGPYYFFGLIKLLRDTIPGWVPLVGIDLGDTNVVPVDYVARAMDHLAHQPGLDGQAFHLVNPEPQSTVGLINTFAAAAKAPQVAVPIDRTVTARIPTSVLPRALQPTSLLAAALRSGPVHLALEQTIGRLGIPPEVLEHVSFPTVYASRATEKALSGSGIAVPDLESYASTLWSWWEEVLDDSIKNDAAAVRALTNKTVVITGASSGIGLVTAVQVAKAGAVPILVARGAEKLEATKRLIESQGGTAYAYPCDLSDLDAIDTLTKQLAEDFDHVDFVVNNAGRSIRRSLKLSEERFHDFERTMQLNYFGAIRLVMGCCRSCGPEVRPRRQHLLDRRADQPAALLGVRRLQGRARRLEQRRVERARGRRHLVHQHPHAAGAHADDRADQALRPVPDHLPRPGRRKVITALVERPHEINTLTGSLGALAHYLAPKTAFKVLHLAYQVFPDSSAAKGESSSGGSESEQMMLARLLKGVHW